MVLRRKFLLGFAGCAIVGVAAQPNRVAVVVGNSMAPTYRNWEPILTKPLDRPLRHGDVVVVNGPSGPILKRVALVAGDYRLQWFAKSGWVDMTMLGRPIKATSMVHTRKIPVPAGTVFLLGDNLDNSVDSREFGPVPIESIRGLAVNSRPPAPGSNVLRPMPQGWLAEGQSDNRLLAHGNAKKPQPTNL